MLDVWASDAYACARWADMPLQLALATAPAVEPLTYAQVKSLLQLGDDVHETWLTSRITAARQKVEQDTGLKLITQAWDLYLDAFPVDAIRPPLAPLLSVTSIKTTTVAGVQSTLDASNYQVDIASVPGRIVLSDTGVWPTDIRLTQGIVIRLSVGYGAAATAVPQPLIYAMEQLLAQWYASRVGSAYVAPPRWLGYDATIAPYRLHGIA
jgi:uncharacterized phiE125 gp8 family phage protein